MFFRRELEKQRCLLKLLKENGCDMCINDLIDGKMTIEDLEREEYKTIVSTQMGYERIYLCKKHLLQLGKTLSEEIREKKYNNDSLSEPNHIK